MTAADGISSTMATPLNEGDPTWFASISDEERLGISLLRNQLLRRPRSFGFFQSVLILSRWHDRRREIGAGQQLHKESLFVRSWPSMVRSGTDIRALIGQDEDDSPPYQMDVAFMGLYGLSSPTPSYFWDYIQRFPDSTLRDFLDIFNNRWIGLFFQSWKRYRWPLVFRGSYRDPMTRRAFCLLGLGTERSPTRFDLTTDSFTDDTTQLVEHPSLGDFPNRLRILAYAGILSQRTRPPCNLETLLGSFFADILGDSARVEIEENVLQWAYLSPADINSLGMANSRIGSKQAFVAGTRVPDRMGAYRVRLGPLPIDHFSRLLPDQPAFRTLVELCRLGSPFGMDFEVELEIKPNEVPDWKLGGTEGSLGRLGWSSWAQSLPRTDDGIVRLRPGAVLSQ